MTASPNLAEATRIYVKNGVLIISQDENSKGFNGGGKVQVKVSYPGVSTFSTYGTGDFEIKDLSSKEIALYTWGTGDIECNTITCTTLTAQSKGTGDIELKNINCTDANFYTQGTGDIEIKKITSHNISAVTGGTGDITLAGTCLNLVSREEGSGEINTDGLKRK